MIPELGHLVLFFTLATALALGVVPLWGAYRDRADLMALARPLAWVQMVFVVIAFALLTISFVRDDFSVLYVASNSNSALPIYYRIAAVWGGHEGSLLLWMLMLAGWTLAVASFSSRMPLPFVARVLAVMGLISVGFLLFTLGTSNPFDRLIPAAADGRDLNPLLQDSGMIFHPPMLYMGYVGFAVAFAFAIAALLGGNLDAAWARWTRPWTTAAWVFLTFGIGLGSWWAYNELGWGGWWFWDPVENASFMPWLVGTALIHSLAVTEKRGGFKAWTVWLAILAFSLSLLGTFLVRSGVLSSVHAFATDPSRGMFILAFLVVAVGSSLALFAWRAPKIGLGQRFGLFSRETLLLTNNMMLAAACGAVLLGTLYPLFLDALGMGKISVGPPYFDVVFALLMAPLVVVMGIGPLTRWKDDEPWSLLRRVRWAFVLSLLAALGVQAVYGQFGWATTGGLWMAFWIITTLMVDLRQRLWPAGGQASQISHRMGQIPLAMWGMFVAHVGIAVFAFGVAMVRTYDVERDVKMAVGDTAVVEGYSFKMLGLRDVQGPNYVAAQSSIEVRQGDKLVGTLLPEKRQYRVQQNPMTESGVDSNMFRDLYVSMGEQLPSGEWVLRLQVKPFITWIWGGCLLMMLGGVLAISDKRYRRVSVRSRRPAANAEPEPA